MGLLAYNLLARGHMHSSWRTHAHNFLALLLRPKHPQSATTPHTGVCIRLLHAIASYIRRCIRSCARKTRRRRRAGRRARVCSCVKCECECLHTYGVVSRLLCARRITRKLHSSTSRHIRSKLASSSNPTITTDTSPCQTPFVCAANIAVCCTSIYLYLSVCTVLCAQFAVHLYNDTENCVLSRLHRVVLRENR